MSFEGPSSHQQESAETKEGVAQKLLALTEDPPREWTYLMRMDKERDLESFSIAHQLLTLPDEDRDAASEFYGRTSAATLTGNPAFYQKVWAERYGRECEKFLSQSTSPANLQKVADKVTELAAFHLVRENDTNMTGFSWDFERDLRQKIADSLAREHAPNSETPAAVESIFNPFHLKKGMVVYRPELHARGLELKEIPIHDIVVDGKDSMIDSEGKTLDLETINRQLAHGTLMLRDGSNYFGGIESKLPQYKKGEMISMTAHNPLHEDSTFDVEYMGTNENELHEKFGYAFIPYSHQLLEVKYRYDGKMLSYPLGLVDLKK
jgi:hypothetical protein